MTASTNDFESLFLTCYLLLFANNLFISVHYFLLSSECLLLFKLGFACYSLLFFCCSLSSAASSLIFPHDFVIFFLLRLLILVYPCALRSVGYLSFSVEYLYGFPLCSPMIHSHFNFWKLTVTLFCFYIFLSKVHYQCKCCNKKRNRKILAINLESFVVFHWIVRLYNNTF